MTTERSKSQLWLNGQLHSFPVGTNRAEPPRNLVTSRFQQTNLLQVHELNYVFAPHRDKPTEGWALSSLIQGRWGTASSLRFVAFTRQRGSTSPRGLALVLRRGSIALGWRRRSGDRPQNTRARSRGLAGPIAARFRRRGNRCACALPECPRPPPDLRFQPRPRPHRVSGSTADSLDPARAVQVRVPRLFRSTAGAQ